MKNYECMMILGSNLTDDKRAALIKKFQTMAGKDATVEKMGMRKFTVPINYRKEGLYVLLHFKAEGNVVKEMSHLMNITDGVERYLFIQKDEKMLAADAERRARRAAARAERVGSSDEDFGKKGKSETVASEEVVGEKKEVKAEPKNKQAEKPETKEGG